MGLDLTLILKFNLVTACGRLHVKVHIVNILQIMLKLANIEFLLHEEISALLFDTGILLLGLLFELIVKLIEISCDVLRARFVVWDFVQVHPVHSVLHVVYTLC